MRASLLLLVLLTACGGGGSDEPDAAPAVDGNVIISEVFYDAAGMDDDGNQWVEIYNADAVTIDVSGWFLCGAEFNYFPLPADVVLAPGDTRVVHWNAAAPATPEAGHIYTDVTLVPMGTAAGAADKSMALYTPPAIADFEDALLIRDFVQWIEADQARADVAAAASIWTASEFVAGAAEGSSLCWNGGDTDGPAGFTADPTPTPLADNAGCN